MVKIYTKTGDDGTTGIQGGRRVQKTNRRIMAYGTVDELNAALGISIAHDTKEMVSDTLTRIQNELFLLGADLSNPDLDDESNRISPHMIECLEGDIDRFEETLLPLSNFILPGGNVLAAHIHHARTVTRRAEIQAILLKEEEAVNPLCMIYLNRLSDLLFVLGRFANRDRGDIIWKQV